MIPIIFTLSFIAGISIVALTSVSYFTNKFQFWPPSKRSSWEHKLFFILFRVMIYGLFVLCVVDFQSMGSLDNKIIFFGVFLFVAGIGTAIYLTNGLGWKNAYGEKLGLKTDGWFRYSRNPIYLVSFVGMIGLGLFVNSLYVYMILGLWALLYIVAPFVEEPWLEKMYGEDYRAYKSKTPRFIGFPFSK